MSPRHKTSAGLCSASLGIVILLGSLATAAAQDCPGNPKAIGTSRVLTVNPSQFPMVGKVQYQETLRLKAREVVLTFDDGPVAPYTIKILEALAAECVKATFFPLGSNVVDAPDLVKRAFDEGHSIGTHTHNHSNLSAIPIEEAKRDIELGIAATTEALGNPRDLTPFFRPPLLALSRQLERHLLSRGMMVWSLDVDSEDWKEPTEDQLVDRIIEKLEKTGKGIVLMHDIQPVTARALPMLLVELKRRNFRIVHVVPTPRSHPASSAALAP